MRKDQAIQNANFGFASAYYKDENVVLLPPGRDISGSSNRLDRGSKLQIPKVVINNVEYVALGMEE